MIRVPSLPLLLFGLCVGAVGANVRAVAAQTQGTAGAAPPRRTVVSIEGRAFHINGRPTYAGRSYKGMKVEGLLMNSRMVQGIFDDRNPETRKNWDYPDGRPFAAAG